MRTLFYDRTAYKLSDEPVPNCFFLLDDHFDQCFATTSEANADPSVWLAESICSRMADVEMYAFLMADARRRHPDDPRFAATGLAALDTISVGKAPILTRSFLLGYLAACHALLDSAALALATLYELGLTAPERHFSNPVFWEELVASAPNVHRRYHSMRIFFGEVARWSSEIPLRLPPIVALYAADGLGRMITQDMQLRALDEDAETQVRLPLGLEHLWVDPLDLHRRWKPNLLTLCERICRDIQIQTPQRPPAPEFRV